MKVLRIIPLQIPVILLLLCLPVFGDTKVHFDDAKEAAQVEPKAMEGPIRTIQCDGISIAGIVSPDGKFVYVVGTKGIDVYIAKTGKKTATWHPLEEELILPVQTHLSADGSVLGLLYKDTIYIVNTETGKVRSSFKHEKEYGSFPGFALSPDGSIAISTSDKADDNYVAWSTESGKAIWTKASRWRGEPVFQPDGKSVLLFANYDLEFCDPATGKTQRTLDVFPDYPPTARFSSDGSKLALCRTLGITDNVVSFAVLRTADLKLIWNFKTTTRFARCTEMCFSPDAASLIGVSGEKQVLVWDAASGTLISEYTNKDFHGPIHFTPDGKHFLAQEKFDAIGIWNTSVISK